MSARAAKVEKEAGGAACACMETRSGEKARVVVAVGVVVVAEEEEGEGRVGKRSVALKEERSFLRQGDDNSRLCACVYVCVYVYVYVYAVDYVCVCVCALCEKGAGQREEKSTPEAKRSSRVLLFFRPLLSSFQLALSPPLSQPDETQSVHPQEPRTPTALTKLPLCTPSTDSSQQLLFLLHVHFPASSLSPARPSPSLSELFDSAAFAMSSGIQRTAQAAAAALAATAVKRTAAEADAAAKALSPSSAPSPSGASSRRPSGDQAPASKAIVDGFPKYFDINTIKKLLTKEGIVSVSCFTAASVRPAPRALPLCRAQGHVCRSRHSTRNSR